MFNKTDIMKAVSLRTAYIQEDVNIICNCFLDALKEAIATGEDVHIAGLGKFQVKDTPPKMMKDIRTGEEKYIAASKRITYTPAVSLKTTVKDALIPKNE